MNNTLSKISINNKLILLLLLPIITLLFYISTSTYNAYQKEKNIIQLSKLVKITTNIANLSSEISKERYFISVFVDNKGKKFENKAFTQRQHVNNLFSKLENFIHNLNINKEIKSNLIKKVISVKKKFYIVREGIRKDNISNLKTTNILNFYSKINNNLLDIILYISKFSNNPNIKSDIITFYNLLSTSNSQKLAVDYGIHIISEVDNIQMKMIILII